MTAKPRVAYQGMPGAYSHLACANACPDYEPQPCQSFEDMLAAVQEGEADYAMVPVENSVAGRVADLHHLLPESGLFIAGERSDERPVGKEGVSTCRERRWPDK